MTIDEAVALLRDAREWLGHGLPCATVCGECIVIARIDAALAAHDEEPKAVEWFACGDNWAAGGGKPGLVLDVVKLVDGWSWKAESHLRAGGYADTLDEAKAAALRAARRMR